MPASGRKLKSNTGKKSLEKHNYEDLEMPATRIFEGA